MRMYSSRSVIEGSRKINVHLWRSNVTLLLLFAAAEEEEREHHLATEW